MLFLRGRLRQNKVNTTLESNVSNALVFDKKFDCLNILIETLICKKATWTTTFKTPALKKTTVY